LPGNNPYARESHEIFDFFVGIFPDRNALKNMPLNGCAQAQFDLGRALKMTDSCQAALDHAAAYRELDGPLHDLQNMSTLLAVIIKDGFGMSMGTENGAVKLLVTEDQFNALHFAARNVADMTKALLETYDMNFEVTLAAA
jgi:hypothetical protein